MKPTQLPLDIGYYESDSSPLASQNCINLYPNNPSTKGALATGTLFRTPGIEALPSLGVAPGRGFHKFHKEQLLFSVNGTNLYSQPSGFTATNRGTIAGTSRVSMADNGVTLCIIVPDGNGYFYNIAAATLETISDAAFLSFGQTTSVTLKDGRFIYTTDDEFFMGSLSTDNNGKDFDALDFEDAEVKSDPIVRGITIKNELYIMGSETIELYQNVAGAAFPFVRIQGATIDKGVTSRFGVIEFDNSFLFLGNGEKESPAIWRGDSGMANKISTTAIDAAIQKYTADELSSVFAWAYTQDGATFAGFTFPEETFVYDATASGLQGRPIWHQRETNGSRWRVNDVVTVFGDIVVSDNEDGRIGRLSRSTTTEYGAAIHREATGMVLNNDSTSFRVTNVELSVTSGSSEVTGVERTVELQYSRNGGRTFTSAGTRVLGRPGSYLIRQIWRRLGRVPYSLMLRFVSDDLGTAEFNRLDATIVGE